MKQKEIDKEDRMKWLTDEEIELLRYIRSDNR